MSHPKGPVETARLTLRPFTSGDFDDLYAYQSRPDVARYLHWPARDHVQVREALRVKFMVRDRGSNFTAAFDAVLADTGIRTVLCTWRDSR